MSLCKAVGPEEFICTEPFGHRTPHMAGDAISWPLARDSSINDLIQSEASLMRENARLVMQVAELQGEGTKHIEERRELQAQIDAIYKALDAAELAAGRPDTVWEHERVGFPIPIPGCQCNCSSCIVIRGIRAFIETRK